MSVSVAGPRTVVMLVGSAAALERYDRAGEAYREMSDAHQRSWGMEPEFEHAQWVVEDLLDWKGIDLPGSAGDGASLYRDFAGRIAVKREVARRLIDG